MLFKREIELRIATSLSSSLRRSSLWRTVGLYLVLTLGVACSHHYDDGDQSPLKARLLVVNAPFDVSLGQGFDSFEKRLTRIGCVDGTPVGKYRGTQTASLSPVSSVIMNPAKDNVVDALENLSRLSGWLDNSPEIRSFADASAADKASITTTRLVVVRGELFTLGKDKLRNIGAPLCADHFVSHLYTGAFFGVTVSLRFKSAAARKRFVANYGASAPFGSGDFSDRAADMSQDLAESTTDFSMTVIQMGGDVDGTVGVLHKSQCTITNLSACSETLSDLLSTFNKSLSFPGSPRRLNGLAITDFATSDYSALRN